MYGKKRTQRIKKALEKAREEMDLVIQKLTDKIMKDNQKQKAEKILKKIWK